MISHLRRLYTNTPPITNLNKKDVLLQGELCDATVNFDMYQVLWRHHVVSLTHCADNAVLYSNLCDHGIWTNGRHGQTDGWTDDCFLLSTIVSLGSNGPGSDMCHNVTFKLYKRCAQRQYSTVQHTKSLQKNVLINDQLLCHFQICLHDTEITRAHTIRDSMGVWLAKNDFGPVSVPFCKKNCSFPFGSVLQN